MTPFSRVVRWACVKAPRWRAIWVPIVPLNIWIAVSVQAKGKPCRTSLLKSVKPRLNMKYRTSHALGLSKSCARRDRKESSAWVARAPFMPTGWGIWYPFCDLAPYNGEGVRPARRAPALEKDESASDMPITGIAE